MYITSPKQRTFYRKLRPSLDLEKVEESEASYGTVENLADVDLLNDVSLDILGELGEDLSLCLEVRKELFLKYSDEDLKIEFPVIAGQLFLKKTITDSVIRPHSMRSASTYEKIFSCNFIIDFFVGDRSEAFFEDVTYRNKLFTQYLLGRREAAYYFERHHVTYLCHWNFDCIVKAIRDLD